MQQQKLHGLTTSWKSSFSFFEVFTVAKTARNMGTDRTSCHVVTARNVVHFGHSSFVFLVAFHLTFLCLSCCLHSVIFGSEHSVQLSHLTCEFIYCTFRISIFMATLSVRIILLNVSFHFNFCSKRILLIFFNNLKHIQTNGLLLK